jgi:UTP:GlnB (protein PII) uridylyltransferase
MRDYYLAANAIRQAADALIARCEELGTTRMSYTAQRRDLSDPALTALTRAGARIALAKVATEAHRAVDSFYITRDGAKVEGDEAALVGAITAALDALEREEAEPRG